MNGLLYLIQLNIYLILFYGLYLLLLRNETFFKMNRVYLMGSTLLAMAIPLMKAQWIKDLFVTEQISEATHKVSKTLTTVVSGRTEISWVQNTNPAAIQDVHEKAFLTANQVVWFIYGFVVTLLLLNFIRKLYLVNKAFRTNSSYKAFSFFNKVLVDEQLRGRETIMDHEMVHVRQWHSLDVIFLELFAAFNWFNPVAFAYKRAIRNIHEFIADETAAATLEHKSEYAILLVSNAFGTQSQKLTNSFYNHSLLKKRLIMLNKNKSQKVAILKYGLSVPLFALMIVLSSATIEKSEAVKAITSGIENGLPMVVEALSNGAIPVTRIADKEPEIVAAEKLTVADALPVAKSYADSAALVNIRRHFLRSIKYPPSDQEVSKTGTTYFTFELDATGAMLNPTVVRSMSEGSKFELLRAAKNAPSFGGGVAGKYILVIKYELSRNFGEAISSPEEPFDFSKYLDYQKIDDAIIRGYVKLSPEEKTQGKLRKYFATTIKYPAEAYKNNLASHSWVTFELDQSGNLINPKLVASKASLFSNELMRVLESGKAFDDVLPGKYILPVLFTLKDKNSNEPEHSIDLTDFKNYKLLRPILLMGSIAPGRPDSVITSVGVETSYAPVNKTIFTYITSDEEGGVVNYIKVDYLKEPVILHNGKVVTYKTTDKGFKLDIPFYPKQPKITVYTAEDAVKNYNESVRTKGLIVVTTE